MRGALLCVAVLGLSCRQTPTKDTPRVAQLHALPYLATTPVAPLDRGKSGVTIHRADKTVPGFHVYCSERNNWFALLDMAGVEKHRIALPGRCVLVKPSRDGILVVHGDHRSFSEETVLARYSWDGKKKWTSEIQIHHDFDEVGSEIYALSAHVSKEQIGGEKFDIIAMDVVVLNADTGKVKRKWDLSPALLPLVSEGAKQIRANSSLFTAEQLVGASDWYHCNSLKYLREDTAWARTGDLLTTCRSLDLLAVVRLSPRPQLVKTFRLIDGAHNPIVDAGGQVLLFDNGHDRGWSQLLRVDLSNGKSTWSYRTDNFFSQTRGGVQELPNGNILVTESDRGRVFELTRDRELVWELWSKEAANENRTGAFVRYTIYRMNRWFGDAIDHPGYRVLWQRVFGADPSAVRRPTIRARHIPAPRRANRPAPAR